MTGDLLRFVRTCVEENNLHAFYTWSVWLRLRAEVLAVDRHECQVCKARGYYRRATIVHHINHVRKRPDLALSKYYVDEYGNKKRQLISLCDRCHELEHPERMRKQEPKEPLTEERW